MQILLYILTIFCFSTPPKVFEPVSNNQRSGHKPNVVINGIEINNKSCKVISIPPYEMDPLRCRIKIFWEVVGTPRDSVFEFRYRLLGASNKWTTIPKECQNIVFDQLQSGKYQFQIFALNLDGNGSEYFASYHFVVLTDWYHSWWFFTFTMVILMAFFYVFIKLSNKRLDTEKIYDI